MSQALSIKRMFSIDTSPLLMALVEYCRKKVQLWGDQASFENGTLPVFDFHELLEDDKLLHKWLVTLTCETGIAKLENIPLERQQLIRLGDRAGYLVSTNYG